MFEIFIVMPIYDKIRDFKRPKALNFEAIYLKKKRQILLSTVEQKMSSLRN